MSSLAPAPAAAGGQAPRAGRRRLRAGPRATTDWLLGLAIAAALALLAFTTTGGVALAANTWAQIALIVIAAGLGLATLVVRSGERASGTLPLLLFAALAALTFASIAWSVVPDASWTEANRTLSYLAAFAAAVALARLWSGRWPALIGGIAGYAVVAGGYALLTKVFPASLDPHDALGRLRTPFDYYNATGLVAALGIPAWVWLGACAGAVRPPVGARRRRRLATVASVPAIGVLVCALVLSYGRGALAAAAIGLAVWFALVPVRLRAALLLCLGALGGVAVGVWATGRHALTHDHVALPARTSAGHTFGILLLVALALLLAAGAAAALGFERVRLAAPVRRRFGVGLLAALALVPAAGIVALATSSRGFGGEVSHLWTSLTSPRATVSDNPSRLAELGSSRPLYWSEGLKVGEHAPLAGTGAFGFSVAHNRYSTEKLQRTVQHAHSYVVQTFADLGALGLLVSAGLLVAWALAVRRTLAVPRTPTDAWTPADGRMPADRPTPADGRTPADRPTPADPRTRLDPQTQVSSQTRAGPGTPPHAQTPPAPALAETTAERAGMITLLSTALIFGVHSTIDWTWFIPGAAVPALICAGWLAGRGPLARPAQPAPTPAARRSLLSDPLRTGGALLLAALALVAVWVVWQPLRSSDAESAAVAAVLRGDGAAALADARTAANLNPVAAEPHQVLSDIYLAFGNRPAARAQLVKATAVQPSNPATWQSLAAFDFAHGRTVDAQHELARARSLDPTITRADL